MGSFTKLKKLLEEKEGFVLVCHIEPDGDALGGMLALGDALRGQGKTVTEVCLDQIPATFAFLPGIERIQNVLSEAEAIILIDNGDARRTGCFPELKELKMSGAIIANIDHHQKNDLWKFVNINYVDPEVCSASEIIYGIIKGLHWPMTGAMATNLLAGIYNDTGGFRHSNTSDTVFSIVSDLLKSGAKLRKISEGVENSQPISKFRLWGIALSRLFINEKYGIAVSVLTRLDIEQTKASEEEISGLVNLLNSAPESKAAMLLYESETGKIKGSLRTERSDVDVSAIAALFGGGGHKKAAGFTIEGKIEVDGKGWKIV